MSLYNLFTQKIVISRLSTISGNKTNYATLTAEYVNIQRMAEEKTLSIGGAIGKTFRMYAEENADIQVGDKLVDTDTGSEYKVDGITTPASLGSFVHKEGIILKTK